MKYLRTVDVPLAELEPFPGNARRGDVAAIRESVRRFGQFRSVLARDPGEAGGPLVVVAGNHTVAAMAEEGHEQARVEVIECADDDEAARINAADNRLAELGGYDDQALVELLAGFGGDFAGTGWTADDLAAMTAPPPPPPDDFPGFGDDIPTDYECPSCHYRWSGTPKPAATAPAAS